MFSDLPVIIVAGGPSVTLRDIRIIGQLRTQDLCRVIAVNDAVFPCWFADHLHAADKRWWMKHDGVPGFKGTKTTVEPVPFSDVLHLKNSGNIGFDERPGHIRTGFNSGAQAIHIAASLGAKQIILLGIDFTEGGARDHWFGLHEPSMDFTSKTEKWTDALRLLVDELDRRGVAVSNAGKNSTLDWLPPYSLG